MKKLVTLLLALCMVLSLAACGVDTAENTDMVEKSAEQEDEPLDKITLWTDAFASSEETVRILCEEFKKDTGVELEWVGFPKEDYDNVVMASLMSCDKDDLPDVIFNAPLGTMLRQEMLYDMAPLFANNAKMNELIQKDPTLVSAGKAGNSYYSIGSQASQAMVLWTREDLVEELDLKQPANLEEFTENLRAIKKAHPEMITLTGPGTIDYWDAISCWFGVKNKIIEKKDGTFVDSTLTPEFKEYMDYMKMLYAEGILDKELPTNTSMGDVRTKFFSGNAAVTLMWDNLYRMFDTGFEDNGIKTHPTYVQPVDGENGTLGLMYMPAQNLYCMTIGAGDETRAQKVFDTFFTWMYTNENGITLTALGPRGTVWDVDENGQNVDLVMDPGVRALDWHIPIQNGWKLPYEFAPREAANQRCISDIRVELNKRPGTVIEDVPGPAYLDYCGIMDDLMTKRTELFHLYITGQSDYNTFSKEYKNYCDEQNLQDMIDEMNAK